MPNWIKTYNHYTMFESLMTFMKNVGLSADEKFLRENGLKDECGFYTDDYKRAAKFLMCQEKEKQVIEFMKKKLAEEKKDEE